MPRMNRDPGRRRKAGERRKKRKQREERKRAATQEELRSFSGRMARAGRWPLHGCRVGWRRGDRRKPHVLIARDGPTGITAAVLLVDLGCLGVKDCILSEDLTPGEYDDLVESLAEGVELEASSPARARKLVETAARHSAGLGFPMRADCAAALALFGDADPAECAETFECGADGMPFYDPGPDDDIREVLRRLEQRLGPRGFQYLLLPGDVEHSEEFPGEDDPDPSARAWGRLRRAESWVMQALAKTAFVHFGERFPERAWAAFAPEWEREDLQDAVGSALDHWSLSRAFEGCVPKGRPAGEEEERSAAEILMEENGARLPDLERRLLQALSTRPFSFHVVRGVEPGKALRLADIFTGEECEVRERSASKGLVEGVVLFARVVTLDSVAVLMGCGAYVIPPSFRFRLLKLRDFLVEEVGTLEEDKLLALEALLCEEFCQIVHALRFPAMPQLQNTDGEELVFTTLHYELVCSPRAALEALKELAFEWQDEDFEREAEFDAHGELAGIEFPWQGRGNRNHPSWTNTTLGQIRIEGTRLSIEVNSAERSRRIQRKLADALGARAVWRKEERKTLDQLRAERGSAAAASGGEAGESTALDPEPGPLGAATARAFAEQHWKAWFDQPIPALGDVSPRKAAETPAGRELLDALLADYAYSSRNPGNILSPDVPALRRELGL